MAEEAVKAEHGRTYGRESLRVEIANSKPSGDRREGEGRYGPPKRTDYRVQVTRLPYHCSWQVRFLITLHSRI